MIVSRRAWREAAIYLTSAMAVLLLWWLFVHLTGVKEYLLPGPGKVLSNMWAQRDTLLADAGVTAWETVLGFVLSVVIAMPMAVLMTESRLAYSFGYPLVVGLQTVPKIAVAPLLVVVLGFGILPKIIVVVLVAFSVLCWIVIFAKALHLNRARGDSDRFMKAFDSAGSLDALAQQGLSGFKGSPYARIFATGYDEMIRLTKGERNKRLDDAQATHVDSITRRAAASEVTHLESWMSLLGTIGSTAPFIGLFGTVYGIMDAFLSIGNQQSANLPVVAPKIAEALIATAIGLVAAIPAVMAYNYFVRRIRVLESETDAFASDYLNIVRRHFLS